MPKTKLDFIREAIEKKIMYHAVCGTNSMFTADALTADIAKFLDNMCSRPWPNGIHEYNVICDETNNPHDRGDNLNIIVEVRLDKYKPLLRWHDTLRFTGKADNSAAFDRAMNGV